MPRKKFASLAAVSAVGSSSSTAWPSSCRTASSSRSAERSEVLSVHFDRPIAGHNSRTAVSVGARAAQQQWGYDGAGIGVAVIDSGISGWHDDLTYSGNSTRLFVSSAASA